MRPKTKGKIENPFQYLEEQFFKGSSFDSIDNLNERLKEFMNTWNKKINGKPMVQQRELLMKCMRKRRNF